jgi:hypothetical protein
MDKKKIRSDCDSVRNHKEEWRWVNVHVSGWYHGRHTSRAGSNHPNEEDPQAIRGAEPPHCAFIIVSPRPHASAT